jgi:hypothetical protein
MCVMRWLTLGIYAASWDGHPQNFDLILQYEFENQILSELGYDLT